MAHSAMHATTRKPTLEVALTTLATTLTYDLDLQFELDSIAVKTKHQHQRSFSSKVNLPTQRKGQPNYSFGFGTECEKIQELRHTFSFG